MRWPITEVLVLTDLRFIMHLGTKCSSSKAAVLRRAPETVVLVRGDYRVAYGEVVGAMTILQRAGADKVGFVTEAPGKKRAR